MDSWDYAFLFRTTHIAMEPTGWTREGREDEDGVADSECNCVLILQSLWPEKTPLMFSESNFPWNARRRRDVYDANSAYDVFKPAPYLFERNSPVPRMRYN